MSAVAAILQSGFVLHTDRGLSLFPDKDQATLIDEARQGKKISFDRNPFFYDKEIDALFKSFISGSMTKGKDFEYREKVFLQILSAFNGITFKDWIDLQKTANTLTDMHVRYLEDTLRFLNGKTRSIGNESWWSLLTVRQDREGKPPIDLDLDSYFDNNTGVGSEPIPQNPNGSVPFLIEDVIVQWVAQPNGFGDLVYFAGIVFASRPDKKRF